MISNVQLPPDLAKFVAALGMNPERLNWKIHYLLQDWERFKKRFAQKPAQKYKYCECGEIALAEYTECPKCGRKLDSYTAYKLKSAAAETAAEFSVVSIGLIAILGSIFALMIAAQGPDGLMHPSGQVLRRFGALTYPDFLAGDYWRIFTAGLCHIGLVHILFNVVAIWQTLPHFEMEVGAARTIIMLTLTELGAFGLDLGLALFMGDLGNPYYLTAGASGMGFGIIGFGVGYFQRNGRIGERNFFLKWCLFGLIFGFIGGFNNSAHAGGFLAGLPLGFLMAGRIPTPGQQRVLNIAGLLCLLVWIGSVALMFREFMGQ